MSEGAVNVQLPAQATERLQQQPAAGWAAVLARLRTLIGLTVDQQAGVWRALSTMPLDQVEVIFASDDDAFLEVVLRGYLPVAVGAGASMSGAAGASPSTAGAASAGPSTSRGAVLATMRVESLDERLARVDKRFDEVTDELKRTKDQLRRVEEDRRNRLHVKSY